MQHLNGLLKPSEGTILFNGENIWAQDYSRKTLRSNCLLYTSYAKKVQGRKMVGGQSTFIPLKVNTAGVIPVIFAQSILQIPIIISQLTGYKGTGPWAYILRGLNSSYWCKPSELVYSIGLIVYIVMAVSYTHLDVYKRQVVRVDADKNLILVKGAVPGPKKALVTIKETVKVEA